MLLGYDLGVAITGHEDIRPTLIITEGFGQIAMAGRTYELLAANAGRRASANGATQIRAGVLRPEIIIPQARRGECIEPCLRGPGIDNRRGRSYYPRAWLRTLGRGQESSPRSPTSRVGSQGSRGGTGTPGWRDDDRPSDQRRGDRIVRDALPQVCCARAAWLLAACMIGLWRGPGRLGHHGPGGPVVGALQRARRGGRHDAGRAGPGNLQRHRQAQRRRQRGAGDLAPARQCARGAKYVYVLEIAKSPGDFLTGKFDTEEVEPSRKALASSNPECFGRSPGNDRLYYAEISPSDHLLPPPPRGLTPRRLEDFAAQGVINGEVLARAKAALAVSKKPAGYQPTEVEKDELKWLGRLTAYLKAQDQKIQKARRRQVNGETCYSRLAVQVGDKKPYKTTYVTRDGRPMVVAGEAIPNCFKWTWTNNLVLRCCSAPRCWCSSRRPAPSDMFIRKIAENRNPCSVRCGVFQLQRQCFQFAGALPQEDHPYQPCKHRACWSEPFASTGSLDCAPKPMPTISLKRTKWSGNRMAALRAGFAGFDDGIGKNGGTSNIQHPTLNIECQKKKAAFAG